MNSHHNNSDYNFSLLLILSATKNTSDVIVVIECSMIINNKITIFRLNLDAQN